MTVPLTPDSKHTHRREDLREDLLKKVPKVPPRRRGASISNYVTPSHPRPHYTPYYPGPYSSSPIQYPWNPTDWQQSMPRWTGEPESPFVRTAEDSVREAFTSIESIVTAFTSVAQMLEATYNSVHSSFRAVLSVADNLVRLRTQLVKILRSFMMFGIGHRVIQRLWKCVSTSHTPHEAVQQVAWEMANPSAPQDIWPFVTFLLVACAGPYFIYKLLPSQLEEEEEPNDTVVVAHSFRATQHDEVSLIAGTTVVLAPPHLQPPIEGWCLVSSNHVVGLVPTAYLATRGSTEDVFEAPPAPPYRGERPQSPLIGQPSASQDVI